MNSSVCECCFCVCLANMCLRLFRVTSLFFSFLSSQHMWTPSPSWLYEWFFVFIYFLLENQRSFVWFGLSKSPLLLPTYRCYTCLIFSRNTVCTDSWSSQKSSTYLRCWSFFLVCDLVLLELWYSECLINFFCDCFFEIFACIYVFYINVLQKNGVVSEYHTQKFIHATPTQASVRVQKRLEAILYITLGTIQN